MKESRLCDRRAGVALALQRKDGTLEFVHFSIGIADMPDSDAAEAKKRVLRSKDRFFEVDDFPGSRTAVARELSRLENVGELRRLRRGLYWRGTETPLGMAPPPPAAVVRKVYGSLSGVGPARLTAARALGLSTQVPRYAAFAVPYLAEGISRVVLVNRGRRHERAGRRLNNVEIALLEVLEDWDDVVELSPEDAVTRLSRLIGDSIRPDRVAAAARTEPARVRERLRALLRVAGTDDEAHRVPRAAHEATRTLALAGIPPLAAAA